MSTLRTPRPNLTQRRARGRRGFVLVGLVAVLGWIALPSARADAQPSLAAYVVIVNAKHAGAAVPRELLADVFLKKATRWDTGEAAAPVDLRADSGVRQAFSLGVLKRPVAAVRRYWTQRIFSGGELPPLEVETDAAVVQYVAGHPGAVGYVSSSASLGVTKPLSVR